MKKNLDEIRNNTLKQMEQTERNYKLAFVGAALVEMAFVAAFVLLADFTSRTHLLLFIAAIATYTIVATGLVALGVHINRNTLRLIRAIETIAH